MRLPRHEPADRRPGTAPTAAASAAPTTVRGGPLAAQRLLGNQQVARRVRAGLTNRVGASTDSAERDADGVVRQLPGALPVPHGHAPAGPVPPAVARGIAAERGGGRPLPERLRAQVEGSLGTDLSAARLHTGPAADEMSRALGATAFTTGSDVFLRDGVPGPDSPAGRGVLAHELAHIAQQATAPAAAPIRRVVGVPKVRSGPVGGPNVRSMLEAHVGGLDRQRELLTEDKAGQGMVKKAVGGWGVDALTGSQQEADQLRPDVSQMYRRLVDFARFDELADKSVLAKATEGGLSDEQKWNVILVNSELMKFIQPGMTVNKIIPDSAVQRLLKEDVIGDFGNSISGSVADQSNYQGITGGQAVSNFGLDYGNYTDKNAAGKQVSIKMGVDKSGVRRAQEARGDKWASTPSPYVAPAPGRPANSEAIVAIPKVFYVQVTLDRTELSGVKVPIHQNVIDYAVKMKADIDAALNTNAGLEAAVASFGAGSAEEVEKLLIKRLFILDKFLANAKFSTRMAVSTDLAGEKNKQDPLTNLGITKPGSRLQNTYVTVNQEYFLEGGIKLKETSGLWLKDETGKDKMMAQLVYGSAARLTWDAQGPAIRRVLDANEKIRSGKK